MLLISVTSANVVNVYEYIKDDREFIVIEKKDASVTKEKDVSFINIKKDEQQMVRLYENVKKHDKKLVIQENLYEIIKNDDLNAFNEFIKEEECFSIINKEFEGVKGFKYPFHQALINKSFNILLKMLSLSEIRIELVEKSGTSTIDILKMYDFEDYNLGKEVVKQYIKKTKG